MLSKTTLMSSEAFEALLDRLDSDPKEAVEKFQALRRRLVKLFEVRGARFPEDLADETISRVALKLSQGVDIEAEDPFRYFCGVAFMVFKEVARERGRELSAMEDLRYHPAQEEAETDRRLPLLQGCLEDLTEGNRELILGYHQGEKRARIEKRRQMAELMDLSATALRLRAHRIRLDLENCVERQLPGEAE